MPNQNINAVKATVTTHRSNSTSAFFELPKDATPQDCKEITAQLISQAHALITTLNFEVDQGTALVQMEVISNLLLQAGLANDMIDIQQAVNMALVEG